MSQTMRIISLTTLLVISLLNQGCSQRSRYNDSRERSSRLIRREATRPSSRVQKNHQETSQTGQDRAKVQTSHRFTFVPFAYEPAVEGRDAAQFSMFSLEWMRDNDLGEFLQQEKTVREMTAVLDQALEPSEALAQKHGVDAVISGIVHDYRYGLESNHFHQTVDMTLTVVSPSTGETIYEGREKLTRKYRVGRDDRDFRELNSRTLNDLLLRLMRKAGPSVQRALKTAKTETPKTETPKQEKKEKAADLKLWSLKHLDPPKDQSSLSFEAPGPKALDRKKEEERRQKPQPERIAANLKHLPKPVEKKPSTEPTPKPPPSPNPKSVQTSASPTVQFGDLNLALNGFSMVWPETLVQGKRYEKLFFVPRGQENSVPPGTAPAASKSVALEVFHTTSRYAVTKFLRDYFGNMDPSPLGRIPQAWERYEMGRWQLGFRLGLKAFIATAPRQFRDPALESLGELYASNGGLELSTVLKNSRPSNLNQKPSKPAKPKTAEMQESQIEAERSAFLLDMARRNLKKGDFDQAQRYTEMAQENGTPTEVIRKMANQIAQRRAAEAARIQAEALLAKEQKRKELEASKAKPSTTEPQTAEAQRLAGILDEIDIEAQSPNSSTTQTNSQTAAQTNTTPEKTAEPTPPQSEPKQPRSYSSSDPRVDEFYSEMEKIEAELEKIRSANSLMTIGKQKSNSSSAELLMQAAILFGFVAAGIGFLAQRP